MSIVVKDGNSVDRYYETSGGGTSTNPFKSVTEGSFSDSPNLDAFSRLRVSNPTSVFDAQLTYDLQPTLFEQITDGIPATITHNSTDRCALLSFSGAGDHNCIMQTFEHFRYQPLKSQLVAITFNFIESYTNVVKFAGYSDGSNGFEFRNDGTNNSFNILSDSGAGDKSITQDNWNLDKLDGTGKSGITLDITKTQILILDFQALYVGRVRMGFDIDGSIVYAHEFLNANIESSPYIQTANLPIRVGMTSSGLDGTSNTTMKYICSAVASEGGQELTASYDFVTFNNVTAGSGTDTHLLSLRPRATFNSITNRAKIGFIEVEFLVTGTNPVQWKLVLGQTLTTPSYADINTTYSTIERDIAGTLSGTPSIVINSGYIAASNQVKGAVSSKVASRYPITLDASGTARPLGTLTLLVQGIGGTSDVRGAIKWREVR